MTITSSIEQFQYQPERIHAGTVYHYIKSNIDGSYPARVYIRLNDEAHVDVWKFEMHNQDAAHVTAHMDWETFSADELQSWVVTADGRSTPQATLSFSKAEDLCTIAWRDGQDTLRIGHYPVHVYNFDFISLNLALRYWTQPEREVELGVVQPNFDPEPESLLKYEGLVTLRYLGDEERNNQPCRKYEIRGEGLRNHTGTIWVNHLAAYIEDMEIPIADNPDWNDFKFRLVSVDIMDTPSWEEFLQNEIRKLNPVGNH